MLTKKQQKFILIIQVLMLAAIPVVFHQWNLQGVDYYFYKAERPWSGGSTYIQECFLQGWLAWMVGAGRSLKVFQGFNLFCAYAWLYLLYFSIYQRALKFSDNRHLNLLLISPLVIVFHSSTVSLMTTLGFPDPLTALFGICLIFLSSPLGIMIAATLGMLSHPTQFLVVGCSAILIRLALHEQIPWQMMWRSIHARAIALGLLLGKIAVWSLQKATFSSTSEQRLKWVSDRNLSYWWELSMNQPKDYLGLHGGFWLLAIFLIYATFKLSRKVGWAYLISLGLGLLTTFISEDRPRIFISIATPGFVAALVYVLSHKENKKFTLSIIILSLIGIISRVGFSI